MSQLESERAALKQSREEHSAAVEHLGQKLAELQTMLEMKDNNLRGIQNKIDVLVQWMDRVNVTKGIPSEFASQNDDPPDSSKLSYMETLSEVDHPASLSLEMLQCNIEKINAEMERMKNSTSCVEELSASNEKLKQELGANLGELRRLRQEVEQLTFNNEKLNKLCEEFQMKEKDFAK